MNKLLPFLADPDQLKCYRDFCLKTISAFNGQDKSEVQQVSHVVESLLQILSTDDFRRDLEKLITVHVVAVLTADIENPIFMAAITSSVQLDQLMNQIELFIVSTLNTISDNFGNFGLMTWCPLLAKVSLKVGLARFHLIRSQFERSGDFAHLSKSLDFHTKTFVLFNQVRFINNNIMKNTK